MSLVLQSLLKAFGQLNDRRILKVLAKSLAITLIVFALSGGALFLLLEAIFANAGLFAGFSGTMFVSLVITTVAMWMMFRIVALAVLQFFADEIVVAVEASHYAEHGQALPFEQDLRNSLRSAGRAMLWNALALPFAVVLIFTAIGPGIVFILVNAVLLGRELTDMCWLRLCEPSAGTNPVSGFERTLLGASVAAFMLIPLANLLAPIIGAAAGTHLVHAKRAELRSGQE